MIVAAHAPFALATAPVAVRAAERAEPSPAELVARSRAAAGGERKAESAREHWLARSAGLVGTLDVVRSGGDMAATLQLGPFHTERGVSRGRRWHQNDNGQTVIENPEPSQVERPVSDRVSRVREPVDAWVLNTTFSSGHVQRTFYDARTYLVVRIEKSSSGHTKTTSYDDFRPGTLGHVRATHYFGSDDRIATDFDYRLASDEDTPEVAASELEIPRDRRPLVEFPAGVESVRLPARIENGRVYVRLRIGGRALDFLLDSGSSSITLDDRVARSLGLTSFGRSTETVAGTFPTQRVIVPSVTLGELALSDVVMRTAPIAENEGTRTRVVGLLGFDFLEAVGLKIDFAAGTVDASRPGALVPAPGSVPLALRLGGQIPVTTVTVGDATGDDFIVDTGAQFDLVLFQRFLRSHPDTAHAIELPRVRYGNAIGGSIPYRSLDLRGMTLGPLSFSKIVAALALSPAALGLDTKDGLVGAGVLGRFTAYFDYAANRLYLGPAGRPPTASATTPAAPAKRPLRPGGHDKSSP